nr:hypothetical protein AOSUZXEW_AOSUZXEW_CDS_0011 [Microvirus sp.]
MYFADSLVQAGQNPACFLLVLPLASALDI